MFKKDNRINLVEATKRAILESETPEHIAKEFSAGVRKLDDIVSVCKKIDVRQTMIERTPDGSWHIMTTDRKDLCTIRGDYFTDSEIEDLRDDGYIYERDLEESNKLEESNSIEYFKQFSDIINKYLPEEGQGDTMASQIVTAVNKLVYRYFNDGDYYDNVMSYFDSVEDQSSYANWLDRYCPETSRILYTIKDMGNSKDYEALLKALADTCFDEQLLEEYSKKSAEGDIYDCDGKYQVEEYYEDDDDYYEDEY